MTIFRRINRIIKTRVHILTRPNCELHDCLRRQMKFFRWAGVFPLEGLEYPTIDRLRFNIISLYGIYYIASFLGQAALTTLSAVWCFSGKNFSPNSFTTFVFHFTALLFMIIMFQLGIRWQILMKRVAKLEGQIRDIRRVNNVKKQSEYMFLQFGIVVIVVNFFHTLFLYKLMWNCNKEQKHNLEIFEAFSTFSAPYLFNYTSFAPWKMIIFKFLHIQAIILFTLIDVIPMCSSMYLKSYFQDLNEAINTGVNKDTRFWEKHRIHFTRLENLVSLVDEHFKTIVLLSFFTYLYFISIRLFNLLNTHSKQNTKCDFEITESSFGRIFYYLLSVIFLIARAFTMSLLAASVQIEARKTLFTLHNVSKEDDNKEIHRFRLQLIYNQIVLTGSYFPLTRSSLLKFISTIITYELVLLQLNTSQKSSLTVLLNSTENYFTNKTLLNA